MEAVLKRTVYILSGPAGVGKTTTSKELANRLNKSAYISGDDVSHMHICGREKPWESEEELALIWKNILCLTKNFLNYGNDVVVDFVTFPREANWLKRELKSENIKVVYVILWTDKNTLIKRDKMRIPENRMGERSLKLFDEFMMSGLDEKHFLNTSKMNAVDISSVVDEIIYNDNLKLE
jgi:2-phosphoglycerate kinase